MAAVERRAHSVGTYNVFITVVGRAPAPRNSHIARHAAVYTLITADPRLHVTDESLARTHNRK